MWRKVMRKDTIAAIATAMSNSGIGIVRISGEESLNIIQKVYKGKTLNYQQRNELQISLNGMIRDDYNISISYDKIDNQRLVKIGLLKQVQSNELYVPSLKFIQMVNVLEIMPKENDEFITFAPYFPEYKCFVESVGCELKVVPADIDTFQIHFEKFEEMITANTKAVIVNSPNNPTGVVLSKETIEQLAELLNKKQAEYDTNIFIICDEPYRELAYGVEVPYIPKFYDNTIVCYSYSKSLSLPGERIGYIFVAPNVINKNKYYNYENDH